MVSILIINELYVFMMLYTKLKNNIVLDTIYSKETHLKSSVLLCNVHHDNTPL